VTPRLLGIVLIFVCFNLLLGKLYEHLARNIHMECDATVDITVDNITVDNITVDDVTVDNIHSPVQV